MKRENYKNILENYFRNLKESEKTEVTNFLQTYIPICYGRIFSIPDYRKYNKDELNSIIMEFLIENAPWCIKRIKQEGALFLFELIDNLLLSYVKKEEMIEYEKYNNIAHNSDIYDDYENELINDLIHQSIDRLENDEKYIILNCMQNSDFKGAKEILNKLKNILEEHDIIYEMNYQKGKNNNGKR